MAKTPFKMKGYSYPGESPAKLSNEFFQKLGRGLGEGLKAKSKGSSKKQEKIDFDTFKPKDDE